MTSSLLLREIRARLAEVPDADAAEAAARRGAGLLADDVVLARWREELDAELIGALILARAVDDPALSDEILAATSLNLSELSDGSRADEIRTP